MAWLALIYKQNPYYFYPYLPGLLCQPETMPTAIKFQGSVYISYAFYVAWIKTAFVSLMVILNVDEVDLLWCLIPMLVVFTRYFRLVRRVWINIFVSCNPILAKNLAKV